MDVPNPATSFRQSRRDPLAGPGPGPDVRQACNRTSEQRSIQAGRGRVPCCDWSPGAQL